MLRQAVCTSSRALRSASRPHIQNQILRAQFAPALASPARRAPASSLRWYSDKSEAAAKAGAEGESAASASAEAKDAGATSSVEAELRKKLEAKEKEALDWKDKCLRSIADFRNLQDRTQKDMKSARDFAIQKFAKDLVDSVDNLDRALSTGMESKDFDSFYEGVKMTEGLMLQTLNKHGLERIHPEGEKFNPNEHEATFMMPHPEKEDNVIHHVQQKGFKLNGRVLRAAKVGVVKNS